MTAYTPPKWEDVKDKVAGKESYDYDTIAYDRLNKDGSKRNLAGIVAPKPISQMTIGELNDWQESEMRNKSRAYGLNIPSRQEELRRQGFKGDPGSTGVGRYQFERSTLIDTAKDLYGDSYRDVVFNSDEQEKLAKHLYTKAAARGPEALGNTWHALRDVGKGAVSTVSAAAPVVAAAATGVVGSVLGGGSPVESETGDIGTLGQYRGKFALYSSKDKLKRKLALMRNRLNKNLPAMAEGVRFKDLRNKIHEENVTRMNWFNSAKSKLRSLAARDAAKSKLRSLAARDDEVVAATDDGADEYTKGVKSRGWYYPTAKAAAAAVTFSAAPGTYCQRKPQSCIDGKPAQTVDADGKPLIDAFGKRTTAGMETGVLHASQWQHMLSDPEEYKKIKALADADPTKGQPGNEEGIARNPDGTEYGNVSDYHKFLLRKGYNVTLQDVWDEDGGYRRNADGSITEESNPIRFKHLRNKIYEQIILNESLEKEDK